MFIKVCGLTEKEHIDWAIELGYSAIGIVLHKKSSRYCTVEKTKELIEYVDKKITSVAVGVTYEEVGPVCELFDFIQIYEKKKIDKLIFAGDKYPEDINFKYFLYDASRGSGGFYGLPEWISELSDRLIISGGLNINNIRKIIMDYKCFGIDVSSGVEKTRGIKDYNLMKNFITEVKDAIK